MCARRAAARRARSGGGLLAGILNKRVVTLETQEGSAYGAALLALSGAYGSVPEICKVAIRETESVTPNAGGGCSSIPRPTGSINRCIRR